MTFWASDERRFMGLIKSAQFGFIFPWLPKTNSIYKMHKTLIEA